MTRLLRHQADAVPQLVVVLVQVAVVVVARCRWSAGRFPVSALSRVDLPAPAGPMTASMDRSASGNVMPSSSTFCLPPSRHRDAQLVRLEGGAAVVDVLDQLAAGQPEGGVADRDDVVVVQLGLVDPGAVDERAVVAAQVDDLVATGRRLPQLGVLLGHAEVGDHDVVVRAAADLHHLRLAAAGASWARRITPGRNARSRRWWFPSAARTARAQARGGCARAAIRRPSSKRSTGPSSGCPKCTT